MEKVKYRAWLAITGGIQGTSREQSYDELGLDSLVKRCWHNKRLFLENNESFTTRLPLLLSRFFFLGRLCIKIIINFYHKTSSNKNKILKTTFFPYCIMNGINLKLVLGMRNQLTF